MIKEDSKFDYFDIPIYIEVEPTNPYIEEFSNPIEIPTSEPENYTYSISLSSLIPNVYANYDIPLIWDNVASLFIAFSLTQSGTLIVRGFVNDNIMHLYRVNTSGVGTVVMRVFSVNSNDTLRIKISHTGGGYLTKVVCWVIPTRIIPIPFLNHYCNLSILRAIDYPFLDYSYYSDSGNAYYVYNKLTANAVSNKMTFFQQDIYLSVLGLFVVYHGDYSNRFLLTTSTSSDYVQKTLLPITMVVKGIINR